MKDDPANSSVDPQSPASEPESVAPNSNYSRWMTDTAADIARLRLSQMAIPGAHNSGVDKNGLLIIEKEYSGCQDHSFSQQLAAGARYLDLRLVDSSYKKIVGNHSPTYKFIEIFDFKHGVSSAGRRLEHLIRDVKSFLTANPDEIVILDFYKYDKGRNHALTSLERCLPYFTPIKHLLIPSAAVNLTIGQIRQTYPGRNIVLNFNYGTPKSWKPEWIQKEQMWDHIRREWSPGDLEESGIASLVNQAMDSPPRDLHWSLSVCVYDSGGPKHLDRNSAIRRDTFKEGRQNASIVMVDFIERTDTQISVTDRCIILNRLRAHDSTAPTAPTNFFVRQMRADDVEDGNYQNTILFTWTASTDNIGVRHYEIFKDDVIFATVNTIQHTMKDLPKKNATFKVRAIDTVGNYSEFSQPIELILDSVPPTIPLFFVLRKVGYPPYKPELAWNPSYDEAGVEGYELKINGEFWDFIPHSEQVQVRQIDGTYPSEKYVFEIRAKDINGLYSEYQTVTRPPLPQKLNNPKYIVVPEEDGSGRYRAIISWDKIEESELDFKTQHREDSGQIFERKHQPGSAPTYTTFPYHPNTEITLESFISPDTLDEKSESDFIDIFFDITPPLPITNLKISSQRTESTNITWTPSQSSNIEAYAISFNEEPLKIIPASNSSYELNHPPIDNESIIEAWAINARGIPSVLEAITIKPIDITPPSKPGIPVITNISSTSATINWAPSTDNVAVTSYAIIINNNPPLSTTSTQHILSELEEGTQYTIQIKAFDTAGNSSASSSAYFRTKGRPTPPGQLTYSNLSSSSVKLSWFASSDDGWVAGYQVSRDGTSLRMVDSTTYDAYWLSPGRTYLFEVRTKDNEGHFSEPAQLQVTTPEASTPPGRVINLRLNTTGSPTLAWAPPETGAIQYIVSKDDRQWAATALPLCLVELPAAGEAYLYEVRARSMADQFSEPVAIRIGFAPPHVLHLTDVTKTSFRLVWDAPPGAVGIKGYQLTLDDAPPFFVAGTQHIFTDLTRGGTYTVTVKTQNESGDLSEPNSLDTYIQGDAPSMPRNFRYKYASLKHTLEWEPPLETSDITGYQTILIGPQGTRYTYPTTEPVLSPLMARNTRYSVEIIAINTAGKSRPLITEVTTS